jgi:hypothetical protein
MARLTGGVGRRWVPVAAAGVRAGVRASGVARRGALTGGPGSTVPPGLVLNRFKLVQTDLNLVKL